MAGNNRWFHILGDISAVACERKIYPLKGKSLENVIYIIDFVVLSLLNLNVKKKKKANIKRNLQPIPKCIFFYRKTDSG